MVKNSKYEILTPSGFKDFAGIRKLDKNEHLVITLSNKKIIKCSVNHPFILDGITINANELSIGTKIDSISDDVFVINIEFVEESIELFDIIEVNAGNVFVVDDVISHNCDFLTSGHTVIESEILQWYEKEQIEEPIERRGIGGDLWIWKYPDYTKSYIICADVARGDGEDYSAFHIIDVENVEQVAEYKGKIDTQMYGNLLVSMATEYNNALLIIDNRNIGWSTIQVAIDSGYKNLYYSFKNDPYLDENIHLRKGYDLKQKENMVPGYSISVKTRPVLVSKLDIYFRDKAVIIHSKRFLNELFVFMWIDGKPQAQKGYNDDLVLAFCMGLMVRDTSLKLRMLGIDLTKKSLVKTHRTVFKPQPLGANQWQMNTGKAGQQESLKWLL